MIIIHDFFIQLFIYKHFNVYLKKNGVIFNISHELQIIYEETRSFLSKFITRYEIHFKLNISFILKL